MRVIVADGDPSWLRMFLVMLKHAGFGAEGCKSGEELRRRLRSRRWGAIFIARSLPDATGVELCREIRARGDATPILAITGRTDKQIIEALDAGADDCVAPNVRGPLLRARLTAVLRRAGPAVRASGGTFSVDAVAQQLSVRGMRGRVIALTPIETRLALVLVGRVGQIVPREDLYAAGWGPGTEVHHNTLDAVMARLRRKIARHAEIKPYRSRGYALRC